MKLFHLCVLCIVLMSTLTSSSCFNFFKNCCFKKKNDPYIQKRHATNFYGSYYDNDSELNLSYGSYYDNDSKLDLSVQNEDKDESFYSLIEENKDVDGAMDKEITIPQDKSVQSKNNFEKMLQGHTGKIVMSFCDNPDLLALSQTNKMNKMFPLNHLKEVKNNLDPIRYFLQYKIPFLLKYLDGFKLDEKEIHRVNDQMIQLLLPEEKRSEYKANDVYEKKEQIELILNENSIAADVKKYIENNTKFDPKKHFGSNTIYEKLCGKFGCRPHYGLAVEHQDNLSLGTYYYEKQCNYWDTRGKRGGTTLDKCVEKCRNNPKCKACSIGNALNDFVQMERECQLAPRATYSFYSVWIKRDENEVKPAKDKQTLKTQFDARRAREMKNQWINQEPKKEKKE